MEGYEPCLPPNTMIQTSTRILFLQVEECQIAEGLMQTYGHIAGNNAEKRHGYAYDIKNTIHTALCEELSGRAEVLRDVLPSGSSS